MVRSWFNSFLHAVHEDTLFAIWFMQNLVDVLSTRMAVGTGRAVELNSLVNALGGPFTMPSLIMKILVVPIITYVSFRICKRYGSKSMAICAMVSVNVLYLAILTNNFAILRSIGV